MVERNVDKALYKIELLVIKVIPFIIALCYLLNNIISYIGIDIILLSFLEGKEQKIVPYDKGKVEEMLRAYSIKVKYAQLEDITYVANMCQADYLKGSVPTEQHLAMYVKETLDDPDGCEGLVFNRWIADMKWLGIAIPWDDFI